MSPEKKAKLYSPVTLAYVGDAVFELLVRQRLVERTNYPVRKLHFMAIDMVNAKKQSAVYEKLVQELSEEELDILKRGRNANTSRVPKSSDPEQYRKATALEALFGFLYLDGRNERLWQLFDWICETIDFPGWDQEICHGKNED